MFRIQLKRTVPLLAWAAFSLLTTSCGAAFAKASEDTQGRVTNATEVAYGDLDLRTAAGANTLKQRIARAAAKVCGPDEMVGAPGFRNYMNCLDAARRDATRRADFVIASARGRAYLATNDPGDLGR